MNLSPVIDIVKKYSPSLGVIISTVNPLAGVVFSAIATAIGANPTNVDEVKTKLASDPDIQIKLQQIELQFAQVESTDFIATLTDTEDARNRDEKVIEDASNPNSPWFVSLIALVPHLLTMLTGFGIVLMAVLRLHNNCTNVNDTFLTMIVGQLLIIFSRQCKFYYGSTKNDKE